MANEISNSRLEVIVIGAGINDARIARDAAMRGLKVLVLDQGDILVREPRRSRDFCVSREP